MQFLVRWSHLETVSFRKQRVCPVSKKELTSQNSHVHHQYPFSFAEIVEKFVKDHPHVRESEIVYDEFTDYNLRKAFADFHRGRARLLVVESNANMSYLKHNFSLGMCDSCQKVDNLTYFSEIAMVLCYTCKYAHFICSTEAQNLFKIPEQSLREHTYIVRPNKISKNFPDMRLYKAKIIYDEAIKTHGSYDNALNYALLKLSNKKRKFSELEEDMCRRRRPLPRQCSLLLKPKTSIWTEYEERKNYFKQRRMKRMQHILLNFQESV